MGTVYPTAHEPDDCNGAGFASEVTVVITDADGVETNLFVNAVGNFYLNATTLATPFTARIVARGLERRMLTPQVVGDCNFCHTQAGSFGAPGRITLP